MEHGVHIGIGGVLGNGTEIERFFDMFHITKEKGFPYLGISRSPLGDQPLLPQTHNGCTCRTTCKDQAGRPERDGVAP